MVGNALDYLVIGTGNLNLFTTLYWAVGVNRPKPQCPAVMRLLYLIHPRLMHDARLLCACILKKLLSFLEPLTK